VCVFFSHYFYFHLHITSVADVQQCFGPLDLNVDISILAGHSLLVTERHNLQKKSGHILLKKAASVGYRSTTVNRLFSSVSTEESLELSESTKVAATKQTKQRWSLQLFGVKVGVKLSILIDRYETCFFDITKLFCYFSFSIQF
jgi:hypothetical protein